MTQVFLFVLSACALFSGLLAKDINITIPPKTVKTLQLDGFMGRWFQMYTSFIPMNTYEKDLVCLVADFTRIQNPQPPAGGGGNQIVSFDTLFSANNGSATGQLVKMKGVASNDDFTNQPGKFILKTDESGQSDQPISPPDNSGGSGNGMIDNLMNQMPFWIVALGDMDANKQYPWAVVSVPLGIDLFILARDITEFQSKYEDQVLKMVHDKGFKYVFNKPIKTFQSTTECKYPSAPAPPTPPTPPTPPATA